MMKTLIENAPLITAIAAIVFGARMAWASNSTRRTELISKIYNAFLEEKLCEFYGRIRDPQNKTISLEQDELFLNKALTLFDEVDYLRSQGLLNEFARSCSNGWEYLMLKWSHSNPREFLMGKQWYSKTRDWLMVERWYSRVWEYLLAKLWYSDIWEYFASEIQYFAFHPVVWDYLVKRIKEGQDRGFPPNIIPFTGFLELFRTIPKQFKADPPPCIPKQHKAFFEKFYHS
jgi:hypothetical protein